MIENQTTRSYKGTKKAGKITKKDAIVRNDIGGVISTEKNRLKSQTSVMRGRGNKNGQNFF